MVIAGKYRVERELGAGGMGTVFEAKHVRFGGKLALKVLHPSLSADQNAVTRFHREARVTSWLRSEHAAKVLDSGVDLIEGEEPIHYLTMEYLSGWDLRTLVKKSGMLSVEEAAEYVSQACLALAEVHALGLVHRDLKPANLFRSMRGDGQAIIKLLDFGISKFTSANVAGDDVEITGCSMSMGSRRFMAPEQMLDAKAVDARADIWALGVILYFLLTESTPFEQDTESDTAFAVLAGAPAPISTFRDDVPAAFEQVIFRCLEKRREQRYSSAAELARALRPFLAASPSSTPRSQLNNTTLSLTRSPVQGLNAPLEKTLVDPPTPFAPPVYGGVSGPAATSTYRGEALSLPPPSTLRSPSYSTPPQPISYFPPPPMPAPPPAKKRGWSWFFGVTAFALVTVAAASAAAVGAHSAVERVVEARR